MRLIARWFSRSITMAAGLVLAVLAMQAPALTRDYAGLMQQLAQETARDIEQRKLSAQQYYGLDPRNEDAAFIEALRRHEPSNAETLWRSTQRSRIFRSAYERIAATGPLLQPLVAFVDLRSDRDVKLEILGGLLANYDAQLRLTLPALIYAFCGFLVGSLLAELVMSMLAGLVGRAFHRRRRRLQPWHAVGR